MISVLMYCGEDKKKSKENKKQEEKVKKDGKDDKVKPEKKEDKSKYDYDKQKIKLDLDVENFDEKAVKNGLGTLQEVKIEYDDSGLTDDERKVLELCTEAAKYIDRAFFVQVFGPNPEIEQVLHKQKNPKFKPVKEFFDVCYGPFDYKYNKAFIDLGEIKEQPKGANFYPIDMTKEEFNKWIKEHPEDKKDFENEYTVIRRKGDRLIAVPYSYEYRKYLEPAAQKLDEAAKYAKEPTLMKFLKSRAQSFRDNSFLKSDADWVKVKGNLEIVIGPFEVYMDKLFGYKAAFEAFITFLDQKSSESMKHFLKYVPELHKNFPDYPGKAEKFELKESPINVVQQVYICGDSRQGIQTAAFNLPNDANIRKEIGFKNVFLKNNMKGKFEGVLVPVGKKIIDKAHHDKISFENFFNFIIHHELSHPMGPQIIKKDGKETTPRKMIGEYYSPIEECKADSLSLYSTQYLFDKGYLPKKEEESFHWTYLVGLFRSIRFGTESAHGRANMIQLNFLKEKGALNFDEKKIIWSINMKKTKKALKELVTKVLTIEATGDKAEAKKFLDKYAKETKPIVSTLDKVKDIPIDIKPVYEADKKKIVQ